jgi:general secretion pathway protein K
MKNRDGYALIAALWFLVLGSAISLEAAHAARKHRLLAAGLSEGAQARIVAAAGIEHARARLATLARLAVPGAATDITLVTDPWHGAHDLLADTTALERARYVVSIRDVNALVNVNRADDAQLRHLLLALRIDARAANRIAQAVLDWRDEDDFRRVDGAERREYIDGCRAVLPRNGPFESVDEVQHVMGMTPELFTRVRPYLTTEGSGRINFTTASAPVLAAAPGMSDEAVAVVLRQRAAGQPVRSAQQLQEQLSSAAREMLEHDLPRFLSLVVFETREVAVTSTGWLDGSPVRVRATAVLVRGGSAAIMTWRQSE